MQRNPGPSWTHMPILTLGLSDRFESCLSAVSPRFAKGPQFHVERPRAAILVHDMPNLFRDCLGLNKEFVGPVLEALSRPSEVDHRIDN